MTLIFCFQSDDSSLKESSKKAKKDIQEEHQTNGDSDGRKSRSTSRKVDAKSRK